ncbi:hypothetical protein HK405_004463 [Cladochytrium tenue]|nr:hypothetical protein HK405_004463 [Cladochytrium tenue]
MEPPLSPPGSTQGATATSSPPLPSTTPSRPSLALSDAAAAAAVASPRPSRASGFFDFDADALMIPLSATLVAPRAAADAAAGFQPIGLFTAVCLIVGLSIGSGIFAAPGPVFASVGSAYAAMSVWLVAGLLVLLGSHCYAELGVAVPGNGGELLYLDRAFGPLPAFLFSWATIAVARPAELAAIALVFGEYAARLLGIAATLPPAPSLSPMESDDPSVAAAAAVPQWWASYAASLPARLLALVLVWALAAANAVSARAAARIQDVFTVLKLASLLVLGAVGVAHFAAAAAKTPAPGSPPRFGNFDPAAPIDASENPAAYAGALYTALWAYDGWNNLNLVSGELKDPVRDLRRASIIGPCIVIFFYLLLNFGLYALLSPHTLSHSPTLATDFGRHLFGPVAALVIPAVVCGSAIATCNAAMFTGARAAAAAARMHLAPAALARDDDDEAGEAEEVDESTGGGGRSGGRPAPLLSRATARPWPPLPASPLPPRRALLLLAALASVLVLLAASLPSLVALRATLTWPFYLLAVVALLRIRAADRASAAATTNGGAESGAGVGDGDGDDEEAEAEVYNAGGAAGFFMPMLDFSPAPRRSDWQYLPSQDPDAAFDEPTDNGGGSGGGGAKSLDPGGANDTSPTDPEAIPPSPSSSSTSLSPPAPAASAPHRLLTSAAGLFTPLARLLRCAPGRRRGRRRRTALAAAIADAPAWLFCAATAWMVALGCVERPLDAVAATVFLGIGAGVFACSRAGAAFFGI